MTTVFGENGSLFAFLNWYEEKEEWFFSIVDVVWALTDATDYNTARKYWNKLKQRLKEEGNELVTNCHQLKIKAADGKRRLWKWKQVNVL